MASCGRKPNAGPARRPPGTREATRGLDAGRELSRPRAARFGLWFLPPFPPEDVPDGSTDSQAPPGRRRPQPRRGPGPGHALEAE